MWTCSYADNQSNNVSLNYKARGIGVIGKKGIQSSEWKYEYTL